MKISKRDLNTDENTIENQKKLWLLVIIQSKSLRTTQKKSVISVKSCISTAIKKTTMLATVLS